MADTLFPDNQPEKKKRKREPDPLWDEMVKIWPQYGTSKLKGKCAADHKAFRELGVEYWELMPGAIKYTKKCAGYLPGNDTLPSSGALINRWHDCKPGMAECLRLMFDEWLKDKPEWVKGLECAYYVFLYIEGMAKRTPEILLDLSRSQYSHYVLNNTDAAIMHTVEDLKAAGTGE